MAAAPAKAAATKAAAAKPLLPAKTARGQAGQVGHQVMKLKIANGSAELQVSDTRVRARVQPGPGVPGGQCLARSRTRRHQGAEVPRRWCGAGAANRARRRAVAPRAAGSIRSPIWVGGGRAFAAKPRDFSQKVNRKMYRGALSAMFSELVRQDRLLVTDAHQAIEAPKTPLLAGQLKSHGARQCADHRRRRWTKS